MTQQVTPEEVVDVLEKLALVAMGTRRDHQIAMMGIPVLRRILEEWKTFKAEKGLHVVQDEDEDEDEDFEEDEEVVDEVKDESPAPVSRKRKKRRK